MKSNCRANGESLHIEFDLTYKICNRCRVIKQKTCFDKKKSICKECNSTKVICEYSPSIISFSGLRSHIKNALKTIDLTKVIHPLEEESEYYKFYLKYCKLIAKVVDIDKLLGD